MWLRDVAICVFDPNGFESKSQTGDNGYWHDDMMWYSRAVLGQIIAGTGLSKITAKALRAFLIAKV